MPQYHWSCPQCGDIEMILSWQDRQLLKSLGNHCAICGAPSQWQSVYAFSGAGIMFGNAQKAQDSDTVLYSEAERRAFLGDNPNIVELKGDQARRSGQALRDKKDARAYEAGYKDSTDASRRRAEITSAVRRGATPPQKPDPRDIEDAMVRGGQAYRVGSTVYRIPTGGSVRPDTEKTHTRLEAEEALDSKVHAAVRKLGIAR